MKIFFRISKLGFGGAERVFISVAQTIVNLDDVEVAFIVDQLGAGETEHRVIDLGIKIFSLDCTRTLKTIIPFSRLIKAERPDVIISAYTDTNFASVISKLLSAQKTKLIISEHASLAEHWQGFSFIRRCLLSIYVNLGYRFADHLLAVSKGIANQLLAMGHPKTKVSYIYNPVRFNRSLQHVKRQDTNVINLLAVGRITPQKDYKTLISALALLVKKVDVKLTIVGGVHDAVEKNSLVKLINDLNLKNSVQFVGFTEDVASYYEGADIFILSSAWEGFGNVIVEALSFGLPVVSTNCKHGPAEILENEKYGRLVPIKSPDILADAVLKTIEELPTVDRSMLKNRASEFSEDKIASQYLNLFREIGLRHDLQ